MFTDSEQIFDMIKRVKNPTERWLAIYITAIREAYECQQIDGVGLVRGSENLDDSLANLNGNTKLETLIETGVDKTVVREWIFRENSDTQAIWKCGSSELPVTVLTLCYALPAK